MGVAKLLYWALFVVLCQLFRVYTFAKRTLGFLANLFYNRQSRLKVLRFLRVDEDEVLQRIRLLEKLPKQVVLSLCLQPEEAQGAARVLQNIVVWASRLQLPELVVFLVGKNLNESNHIILQKIRQLGPQSAEKELFVGQTKVTIESLTTFYSEFLTGLKEQASVGSLERHKSPLVLLFNKTRCLAGTPFPYLISGELLFVGSHHNYSILDFEENLKEYSETRQRCGK